MIGSDSGTGAAALWIVLLTVASTATTLAFACATPFPALATLAALHMRRRDGLILVLLAWAASQAVGFGLLAYPHDAETLAWALGLATAAVGSAFGTYVALRQLATASFAVRLVAGYVAAFIAFKLVVLLWSFALGGVATTFSPATLLNQFVRNGAILLGLLAVYHVLVRIGLPAAPATMARAHAA